jgi:hypothetical protein
MEEILKQLTDAYNDLRKIVAENERKSASLANEIGLVNERSEALNKAEAELLIKQNKYKDFDSIESFRVQVSEKDSSVREMGRALSELRDSLSVKADEIKLKQSNLDAMIAVYKKKVSDIEVQKIKLSEEKENLRKIILNEIKGKLNA